MYEWISNITLIALKYMENGNKLVKFWIIKTLEEIIIKECYIDILYNDPSIIFVYTISGDLHQSTRRLGCGGSRQYGD